MHFFLFLFLLFKKKHSAELTKISKVPFQRAGFLSFSARNTSCILTKKTPPPSRLYPCTSTYSHACVIMYNQTIYHALSVNTVPVPGHPWCCLNNFRNCHLWRSIISPKGIELCLKIYLHLNTRNTSGTKYTGSQKNFLNVFSC